MYIVAGLGNPSGKYEKTRHNVGFDFIDIIAKKYDIKVTENKHRALCGTGWISGEKVMLVKPQTFMNLSGDSLSAILNFYKILPENLIVVYDDITLEPGKIRIRRKGSAGGHNGIKSIIAQTKTQEFPRIRIGVGEKPAGWDLADYVLGHFSKAERQAVEDAMEDAVKAAEFMIQGEIEKAMNFFN